MLERLESILAWLFGPGPHDGCGKLWARWLFLRALGAIYFSAFFSLLFQAQGLIGPRGILPAGRYLEYIRERLGTVGYWYAPSLLWWSSSAAMLSALYWAGIIASLLVVFNLLPRVSLAVCWLVFLSFISGLQDFASYQSEGMLLGAGFVALFFAPGGLRPGLGAASPPSRASTFLLLWEWFRIYFESGLSKIASGDPTWRNLTAMDQYYQNGPLPTWIGWYVQHLPEAFHRFAAGLTLLIELGLVLLLFLPRRFRIAMFFIVTPFELSIIATANYCFLNYIVLWLGILLLDDQFIARVWPYARARRESELARASAAHSIGSATSWRWPGWPSLGRLARLSLPAICLSWVFYGTVFFLIPPLSAVLHVPIPELPAAPVRVIQPFSIANRYALFARMTWARYEIEFDGSDDGKNWIPYPFRFKPQELEQAPLVYAPYHPRFEWNLWFAMLGTINDSPWVMNVEVRLLHGSPPVLELFAGNPFPGRPPKYVRAILYQYWFTSLEVHRRTGFWWRREYLGRFGPTLSLSAEGRPVVVDFPDAALPSP
ncbi:MAG TPA: lipase maturation factor family protein [Candidatus Acidoferrales bacterium]|nr:lipase maturation factor family protein [Candidatus Acidoferrales bacterium]